MSRTTGTYQISNSNGEEVRAFVPYPLPPREPPLAIEGQLATALAEANAALGRLAVAGTMVPNAEWFLYGFVRKEAVISSQIEGTQANCVHGVVVGSRVVWDCLTRESFQSSIFIGAYRDHRVMCW